MPQDLKKVSDEQLQALGMRPAEQRKLRKISEKVVVQSHGQVPGIAEHAKHNDGATQQSSQKHTDL